MKLAICIIFLFSSWTTLATEKGSFDQIPLSHDSESTELPFSSSKRVQTASKNVCEPVLESKSNNQSTNQHLTEMIDLISRPFPEEELTRNREINFRFKRLNFWYDEDQSRLNSKEFTEYSSRLIETLIEHWFIPGERQNNSRNISNLYILLHKIRRTFKEKFEQTSQDTDTHFQFQALITEVKIRTIQAISRMDLPAVRLIGLQELMLMSWLRSTDTSFHEEPFSRIWAAKVHLAFVSNMIHETSPFNEVDLEYLQRLGNHLRSAKPGWVLDRIVRYYLLTIRIRWLIPLSKKPSNYAIREVQALLNILLNPHLDGLVANRKIIIAKAQYLRKSGAILRRTNSPLMYEILTETAEGTRLSPELEARLLPDREASELAMVLKDPAAKRSYILRLLNRYQDNQFATLSGAMALRLIGSLSNQEQYEWLEKLLDHKKNWDGADLLDIYPLARNTSLMDRLKHMRLYIDDLD